MGRKEISKPRIHVRLTALWGNDDAESTIKISRRRWQAIRQGAEYVKSTWSWHEGTRYPVTWSFANGAVSVDGEDGMQCLLDVPVDELMTEEMSS